MEKTPVQAATPAGVAAAPAPALVAHGSAEAAPMSMGALIKASVVRGNALEAKRVSQEWMTLCLADTQKALFAAVDASLELAGISGAVSAEDVQSDPGPFLEQLPEWVRERNLDLVLNFSFSTVAGRPGKRSVFFWERFWALGLGGQNIVDILKLQLPELLERWMIPMSHHGIRTLRHVAMVAAVAIAQALGHHHRELSKQLDTIKRQLAAVGGGQQKQKGTLETDMQLLEDQIKQLGAHRQQLLENTIPHRNRDHCENIRLHSLVEVDRLMKQEPALYLQQKWTARIFLMIHDQNAEVRLKALATISSWFERLKNQTEEVKEHLLQFAERCMLHIVDRSRDIDGRVACKAIRMLRLPVLAERMTDEEVERIVNLVSNGTEAEVRQEAALFVNAQVFQDPGICLPEGRKNKKRRGATGGRERERGGGGDDANMSEMSDAGDPDEEREREEPADNIATLLNSETSISMFIEYLENYMGQSLRLTDRAVNAFWNKAPCLSHWHTMVSLMILGESNKGPGLDPVSTRQRLILLHVMEAAVRRATEEVKKAATAGVREKECTAKMDTACTTIVPELSRLFELCGPEDQQVLIVSHICKMLIDHAESRNMKEVIWNAKSLAKVLKQCILNRGFTDVVKHCTDALLVISVFVGEVRSQFIEVSKKVHGDTVAAAKALCDEQGTPNVEELSGLLGKFNVINQRGIDMSLGNHECLDVFFKLLDVRVSNMRKWQDYCKNGNIDGPAFQFPAGMPDTTGVIYLIENCVVVLNWYFRFCHWEHHSPGSTAVQELDSMQATRIKETRAMLPKVFLQLRNQLCAIMASDGSPHVKLTAFSSYLTIMQVAVGVSEGMDVEKHGGQALPPGTVVKTAEDLELCQMPLMRPEHQQVMFGYLNELFSQVQGSHAVPFDDEGLKVEPHDNWPPLALAGQCVAPKYMIQELLEGRVEVGKNNDFEAEDGDKGQERQLFRAVICAKMVLESEIEDVHAGPIGQLVLCQLDRSKPRPLREVALKLKKKLRDLARISTEFAEQYFETQMSAVVALYKEVGMDAAKSIACEFARQWGPRLMPWLEKPLFETLLRCIDECGEIEHGLPLLEAFSYWLKGEDFVTEARRQALKAKVQQVFQGVDLAGEEAKGLQRFVQRCEASYHHPAPEAAAEPMVEALEAPAWTPGKRLHGKQTVHPDAEEAEDSTTRKKPRTNSRSR